MKKGVPVSPGVTVARAFCMLEVLVKREPYLLEPDSIAAEIGRLDQACTQAMQELDKIVERVSTQVGEDEAAIFRAHRLLLRDPSLINKVKNIIRLHHRDAASALRETLDEYGAMLSKIPDAYLRDRMADIRDVVSRIATHLSVVEADYPFDASEPIILVAAEILPSQATAFDRYKVAGIVTEAGSTTGHAAIIARALGIPAVTGVRGILREVHTGDLLVIDGREGHIIVNPGPEVEAAYRKLQREYFDLRDRLIENQLEEPVTLDGVGVELLANINGPGDAVVAGYVGASGIGLYRTEYLFLTHPTVPDEEEQLAVYAKVVLASPNNRVVIRMLDLGGDKQVPYLGQQCEANPFMGWRSIRLSSAHPGFFQTQLRAILRAGLHGEISLLFPMISTLEEIRRLRRMVERVAVSLTREGVPFSPDIPIGVMIEVPSAALCIDTILEEVDFVSIGSNDLIQYVMAADRDNPKVAHLCEPFNPAVWRLLKHVIEACNSREIPVTLCGEMAGRPRCLLPLLGLGLRSFSMSPALVPPLKELIRRTTLPDAEEVVAKILGMKTIGEIRGYLSRKVRRIWPNVSWLDA
jgi:phosphoenolpyruvate-protein phosphotransferase (PTS system enzyme I)